MVCFEPFFRAHLDRLVAAQFERRGLNKALREQHPCAVCLIEESRPSNSLSSGHHRRRGVGEERLEGPLPPCVQGLDIDSLCSPVPAQMLSRQSHSSMRTFEDTTDGLV